MKKIARTVIPALRRALAALMIISFAASSCPSWAAPSVVKGFAPKPSVPPPPPAKPPHGIKKRENKPNFFKASLSLPADPSDRELESARVFKEPLVPVHTQAVKGENAALAKAILAFKAKKNLEDVSDLTGFLSQFPNSRFAPALQLNLGLIRFETGYLSDAMTLWQSAWKSAKGETAKAQKAVADEAIGQLLVLEARLGRKQEIEANLAQLKGRTLTGSVEAKVKCAKDGLGCMKEVPGLAYRCGPYALTHLFNSMTGAKGPNKRLAKVKSTDKGTSLAQLKDLADEIGLKCQLAKRHAGAPLVVPSLLHFGVGHFAALVSEKDGSFHVKDPTFDNAGSRFLSANAIDQESDGYFLIPDGPLPEGWEKVDKSQAKLVWGKGVAGTSAVPGPGQPKMNGGSGGDGFGAGGSPPAGPPPPKPPCKIVKCNCPCKGMAVADVFSMQATLNIQDVPLGYQPPVGPAINFLVNYNQNEANQPATFTFPNLGPDWSLNWVSSMTFDGSGNATVLSAGGGSQYFAYPYAADLYNQDQLVDMGSGVYQLQRRNGSYLQYDLTDGSGRVFLTKVADAQGNSATIQYDANYRVTSVTDALGQESDFTYGSNTSTDPGFYVVTQITDPFSRSCSFSYDSSYTNLLQITDMIGMTSKFTYLSGSSFINSMTTPYGTTTFRSGQVEGSDASISQVLNIAYPDGTQEQVQNIWGGTCVTTYYSREAMELDPGNASRGGSGPDSTQIWWATQGEIGSLTQAAIPMRVISPASLASRISDLVYAYSGQTYDGDHYIVNSSNQPTEVGNHFLDQFTYNSLANITSRTDNLGRNFTYTYDTNGIDMTQVAETKGSDDYLLGQWSNYNSLHEPQKYIDGSGQETDYTYNSAGQLETITDALSNVTTMTYDSNGYLTQVQGPLSGSSDITTISYDGYGRVYQVTDSEGYTLTYTYDDMDRVTKVTYPDGTTDSVVYDRLDPVMTTDRIGRVTQSAYDSMDQLIYQIDPLGRKTQYSWCACGSLHSLTDPDGKTTTWNRDIMGRVLSKIYPDQTKVTYTYEGSGLLSTVTDALGQTKTYTRNGNLELTHIGYTNSVNSTSNVTISWDSNFKRVTSVQNGWGTISYTYNPYITSTSGATTGGGMLASVTNDVISSSDITYSYDELGRVTKRQINGTANEVDWAYDAISRITSETNALGTFDYSYVDDDAGYSKGTSRLSSISYPNGQTTYFNWFGNDKDQRLQSILNLKSDGTALSNFGYQYDPAGQITLWQQQQGANNNKMYKLGYDKAGQLISAQSGLIDVVGKPFGNQYFYSYDKSSNRTSAQQSVVQPCVFGGTLTTGDTVTVTVYNSALSGGQESVSYTLEGWETSLLDLNNSICGYICADSALQAAGINAVNWNEALYLNSTSANQTTFDVSFNSGATETVTYGLPENQNAIGEPENSYMIGDIVGTITTGDQLTLTVHDPGLTGGSKSFTYDVASGDDAGSINWAFMDDINGDSDLYGLGITATLYQNKLIVYSYSDNTTTYTQSVSSGATEKIEFDLDPNPIMNALVGGTVTVGDELTITAYDPSLTGGSTSVTYTVQSGDTLQSIAQGIATAIQDDPVMPFLVYAYAFTGDTRVMLQAISPNVTTYRATVSSGSTETLGIGYNNNGIETVALTGTITPGDTITLTVIDPALSGGQKSVSYLIASGDDAETAISNLADNVGTDTDLTGIGLSDWWGGPTMFLYSTSSNSTNYEVSVSSGGTETMTLGPGAAGTTQYAYNNVNELVSTAQGGNVSVQGTTNKPVGSASVATPVVSIAAAALPRTTYAGYATYLGSETITLGQNQNGNTSATIGGTITAGQVVEIDVFNSALSGGLEKVPYIVQSGDTTSVIATALTTAFNADSALSDIGLSATSSSSTITISSSLATTYSVSTSGGATETLTLGDTTEGNVQVLVGGTPTTGDTVTVTASNVLLPSGSSSATYTVASGDSLLDVANGLAGKVNDDSDLTDLGLSATSIADAQLADSETFSANAPLAAGVNPATVSATDGDSNTVTDSYPVPVTGGNAATLTYDKNGNLTSDGTNSYSWDAENRLIKITYAGSGNYTVFQYSPASSIAKIEEFVSGTLNSSHQYVPGEERDDTGAVVKQYLTGGQTVSGTAYYATFDHLNSTRELTDDSANLQAQYSYDPYGQRNAQETVSADLQYMGAYTHVRSGLIVTQNRLYSSSLGRWLNTDPIDDEGSNSYCYANNAPMSLADPTGLTPDQNSGQAFSSLLVQKMNQICHCCCSKQESTCRTQAKGIGAALAEQWSYYFGKGKWLGWKDTIGGYYCYDWAAGFLSAINSRPHSLWKTQVKEYQAKDSSYIPLHYAIKLYVQDINDEKCYVYIDDGFLADGLVHTGNWPTSVRPDYHDSGRNRFNRCLPHVPGSSGPF